MRIKSVNRTTNAVRFREMFKTYPNMCRGDNPEQFKEMQKSGVVLKCWNRMDGGEQLVNNCNLESTVQAKYSVTACVDKRCGGQQLILVIIATVDCLEVNSSTK